MQTVSKHLSHIWGEYFPFKLLLGGEKKPNKYVSTFLCHGIVSLILDENNQQGRHLVCGLIESLFWTHLLLMCKSNTIFTPALFVWCLI